ncbi:MAG: geranylgeranylglycerol-phosphate geranylgeranyltransferase [Flavobacteriaceae bacterium]|nr:geranylgeranylglycerol-phosphate geranylgeranyltransferase [Flavobacteriaceae bacterium]
MINFFKLIRWQNLVLILLIQVLIKYVLFNTIDALSLALSDFNFGLLVLATVCIAAAGNIINDIYDLETDQINKPDRVIIDKHISEKTAFNWYVILTIIAIGIGFYLANQVQKTGFAVIFIGISALLYMYATHLKQATLIGNLVIAGLVSMVLLVVGLFDLLPVITAENQLLQLGFFKILMDYAIFALMINLCREILKDIEDIDGDHAMEMRTLPIVIGRLRATKVVFALSILLQFLIVYYIISEIYEYYIAVVYFLLCIVAPLLVFSIKIFTAETKKELQHLSNLLKFVMLFGVLSILLYPFILN